MKKLLLALLASLSFSCTVMPANLQTRYRETYCFEYLYYRDHYVRESCWSKVLDCAEWEMRVREQPHLYTVLNSCRLR